MRFPRVLLKLIQFNFNFLFFIETWNLMISIVMETIAKRIFSWQDYKHSSKIKLLLIKLQTKMETCNRFTKIVSMTEWKFFLSGIFCVNFETLVFLNEVLSFYIAMSVGDVEINLRWASNRLSVFQFFLEIPVMEFKLGEKYATRKFRQHSCDRGFWGTKIVISTKNSILLHSKWRIWVI